MQGRGAGSRDVGPRRASMQEGTFSRTAERVAIRRAAHQLLDQPRVLDDPLALRIIGSEAEQELRSNPKEDHSFSRAFRAFMAARSRYTEDELAGAFAQGVRQYVVLGAGLDTFAYRNPHPGLRVFEVDHPATQAWKRRRLADAQIALPDDVTFVALDFASESLPAVLRTAGVGSDAAASQSFVDITCFPTLFLFDGCGRTSRILYGAPPDLQEQVENSLDSLL